MDDSGSDDGGSPMSILKKNKKKKKDATTTIVDHQRPFKLLFAQKQDLGRSYVSLVKPLGLDSTITSKFYAKDYSKGVTDEAVEQVYQKITRMFNTGPREKYGQPVLDSHNYGWHHTVRFDTTSPHDRRFHYGIRDSHMVKSQVRILYNDIKTGRNLKK